MLTIIIGEKEYWDDDNEEFVKKGGTPVVLEHSLVSISKWESKWHKPFLGEAKTLEETKDYVRCMTLTQNVPKELYEQLSNKNIEEVNAYIDNPMTATTITEIKRPEGSSHKKEKITSEVIYSWMISLKIPVEFQKWHLNRLMTLIRVVSINNNPDGNKMSKKDNLKHTAAVNKTRRAQHRKKG